MSLRTVPRPPHIVREGLIAYSTVEEVQIESDNTLSAQNLLFTPICKPHYIAYEHQDLARHRLRRCIGCVFGGRLYSYGQLDSGSGLDLALKRADNIIFGDFNPN